MAWGYPRFGVNASGLNRIDEIVLSRSTRSLATDVAAHVEDSDSVSCQRHASRVTDNVAEEMTEWRNYPYLSGDVHRAIMMKARSATSRSTSPRA